MCDPCAIYILNTTNEKNNDKMAYVHTKQVRTKY